MARRVRFGVVGLGSMGRHHVRILSRLEGVELVGGADPQGDGFGVLLREPLFTGLEPLIESGIDAAIVAVPTRHHESVAVRLADERIHTLIEKPLSTNAGSARRIAAAFSGSGAIACVGHIERFNAAVREMKERIRRGELGRIFSIQTERVGPYPSRIGDVGVIEDLATHDIDLVTWLGGESFDSVQAHATRQLNRTQDDLVEVIGRLRNGIVVRMSVNWLTPTKKRRISVLGEKGALEAELLSSDLTFYSNAAVPTEWDEIARLRGVAEGDMIRYAITKQEPLRAELESFVEAIQTGERGSLVGLEDGARVLDVVDQIKSSVAGEKSTDG